MNFDFKFFKKTFTDSLKDFANELSKVRGTIEELQRQREDILYAPACRAEVIAAMTGWVDRQRTEFESHLKKVLLPLVAVPGDVLIPGKVDARLRMSGLSGDRLELHHIEVDRLTAGLFSNLIGDLLQQSIKAMPWPDKEGLPYDKRQAAVAEVDALLADAKANEKRLLEGARSAGINVE